MRTFSRVGVLLAVLGVYTTPVAAQQLVVNFSRVEGDRKTAERIAREVIAPALPGVPLQVSADNPRRGPTDVYLEIAQQPYSIDGRGGQYDVNLVMSVWQGNRLLLQDRFYQLTPDKHGTAFQGSVALVRRALQVIQPLAPQVWPGLGGPGFGGPGQIFPPGGGSNYPPFDPAIAAFEREIQQNEAQIRQLEARNAQLRAEIQRRLGNAQQFPDPNGVLWPGLDCTVSVNNGVIVVQQVPVNTVAWQIGLQPGDVIWGVDGRQTNNWNQAQGYLNEGIGQSVHDFIIQRSGQRFNARVTPVAPNRFQVRSPIRGRDRDRDRDD